MTKSPGHADIDVSAYLERIGLDDVPPIDLTGLTTLQLAHLSTVPFENLDVHAGTPVQTDAAWSLDKVVNRRRGGWCFELNGAFAALLDALGFDVGLLGAAVLLDGPNATIDHLALEVQLDTAYLVDVGFGDSFNTPLDLNRSGPQAGGSGTFEFIQSSQGLTMTKHDSTGVPEPQYRFKRVHHTLADFDAASLHLQSDRSLHWSTKRFATRLIDGGPTRLTLLSDRLKTVTPEGITEEPVADADWDDVLQTNFGIAL